MLEQFFFMVFSVALFVAGYYLGKLETEYEDGYIDGYREGFSDANEINRRNKERIDDLHGCQND